MKGVIFDMDGTMVDNMMVHHEAWKRKLATLGIDMSIEEIKETVHGINEDIVERLFGNRFSQPQRMRISWEKEFEYRTIFKDRLKLIEGLPELLDHLKDADIPMAIGTAAPPENVNFVLDSLKIRHYFKSVLHSRQVTNGKPHPEVFLNSARNLGIPVHQCLVFEDSVVGAQTALNAGCKTVIVTTTHQQAEFSHFPHVIRFIKDYKDLTPDILMEML